MPRLVRRYANAPSAITASEVDNMTVAAAFTAGVGAPRAIWSILWRVRPSSRRPTGVLTVTESSIGPANTIAKLAQIAGYSSREEDASDGLGRLRAEIPRSLLVLLSDRE